jgi:broad specificity phosphatase PhoE
MTSRIILVRHGESEGNAAGVLQGRLDYALSELGRRQAALTAQRLAGTGAYQVLSSPLLRASATAALIAERLELKLRLEPDLAEYDIGDASGLTPAELRERFPEVVQARSIGDRLRFPGEEGRDVFQDRLRQALGRMTETEGTTIAVAHGGVISAMCHMVVGLDVNRPGAFHVGNCSLTELRPDRTGALVIHRHNDTCHLDDLATFVDRG